MNFIYDPQEVAKRIKAVRKDHKDTQMALAEKLNVSVDTIKRMENGTSISVWALGAIADEYQESLDYLVTGKEAVLSLDDMLSDCSEREKTMIWKVIGDVVVSIKSDLQELKTVRRILVTSVMS